MLNYSQEKQKLQLPPRTTRETWALTEPTKSDCGRGDEDAALTVGEILDKYENGADGWRSRAVKGVLVDQWVAWISEFANWKNFVTLTFKVEKTPDVAMSLFKWWVRLNNQKTFGNRYERIVGHSYFSYCVGMEYQKRDVVHFHVLTDKPLDFLLTHTAWGSRCGFAWIDGNLKNKEDVITYVCKYILKGGEIDQYKAKKDYCPKNPPIWWREGQTSLARAEQRSLFSAVQLVKPLPGSLKEKQLGEMATRQ